MYEDAGDVQAELEREETNSCMDAGGSMESQASTPQGNVMPKKGKKRATQGNVRPKKGKKRAKTSANEVSLNAAFGRWMNVTTDVLNEMAKSLGYEKELSASRRKVCQELGKLQLTQGQKFKACANILVAEARVDNFYGVPDEEKQAWVIALLNGEIFPLV